MRGSDWFRLGAAVMIGMIVLFVLFPYGCQDDGTVGVCFSPVGNRVPTVDTRLSAAAGIAASLVSGAILFALRPRRPSN